MALHHRRTATLALAAGVDTDGAGNWTWSATLPLRLVNALNAREHWAGKARRAKRERGITAAVLRARFGAPPPPPLVITLTRSGPRQMDSDNLAASAKHVRDGIADWLGVDDGDPALVWRYAQERGPYGVRIEVRREVGT